MAELVDSVVNQENQMSGKPLRRVRERIVRRVFRFRSLSDIRGCSVQAVYCHFVGGSCRVVKNATSKGLSIFLIGRHNVNLRGNGHLTKIVQRSPEGTFKLYVSLAEGLEFFKIVTVGLRV